MKKAFLIISIFTSLFFLSACLQVDTNVFVDDDGSGSLEETIMFKEEVVEMMKQFIIAFDSTKSEDFNLFNEEELISKAEKYGEGVTYISSERLKSNGFKGVKVKYAFNDISKLNLSLISDEQVPGLDETKKEKSPDEVLKFLLSRNDGKANLKIFLPSLKQEVDQEQNAEVVNDSTFQEEFENAKQMFSDMRMTLKVISSKKIIQTDADFIKNNQITLMELITNALLDKPDLLRKLSGNKIKSLDEFRQLTKGIEGIKIESKNLVQINF